MKTTNEPEHTTKPRANIYLRSVNCNQLRMDDPRLLSLQLDVCLRKTTKLGADKAEVFTEMGKATGASRPCLQEFLCRVAEQKPDYVIVQRLSRLSRNWTDVLDINRQIEAAGARLVSADDLDDDKLTR